MRFILFIILSLNLYGVHAQYSLSGKVVDAERAMPLAFANITINNSNKGVISDIDGNFKLTSTTEITSVKITYLGYEDTVLNAPFANPFIVQMTPSLESLDEITITNGENPANAIIRKVIANKDNNNPMKKGGFKYTSYSKSIVDSDELQRESDSLRKVYSELVDKGKLDVDTLDSFEKTLLKEGPTHIAVLESVTERQFLPPDLSEETVIGSKVSGFQNAYIALLATELQPFGFYEDNIDLLELHFLNPIANGSLKKYDFRLEEELLRGEDTIFHISFRPKQKVNIDGLKGFMYVNSSGYAIQNIVAEPNESLELTLKIQQKYSRINQEDWFPEQLNFEIRTKELGLTINGKTYLTDIELIDSLSKKDFSEVGLKYEDTANAQPEEFWESYRKDELSSKEELTYRVVDSLGEEFKFDKILNVATSLSSGNIPWGVVDVKLNRFFGYNRFEGLRLGAGLQTNEKLFKNLSFGGYFAYGLKDSNWKFGANTKFDIQKEKEFSVELSYSNDVREIGSSALNIEQDFGFFNFRDFIAREMDIVEQFKFSLNRRDFKYLTWKASLQTEWVRPQYDVAFVQGMETITNYRNTEASLSLQYAHRERIIETPFRRISLGTKYPVFNLRYAKGFDSFLGGTFDYNKIEASLNQTFFTKNLGKTRYHLQAGVIDGSLPLGLLFTGEGSFYSNFPFVMYDHFQTMRPYEFVSDQYVHLFFTHDFGSLIFKTGNFKPGIVVHQNMGWGDLQNTDLVTQAYTTMEHLFIESGVELTNLIRTDAFGYKTGLGIGGFYRYGFYGFDNFDDNFAFKLNTTIEF